MTTTKSNTLIKVTNPNGDVHTMPYSPSNLKIKLNQNRLKGGDLQSRIETVEEESGETIKVYAEPLAMRQRENAQRTISEKESRILELEAQLKAAQETKGNSAGKKKGAGNE